MPPKKTTLSGMKAASFISIVVGLFLLIQNLSGATIDQTFTYDRVNRLTADSGAGYTYDAADDLLTITVKVLDQGAASLELEQQAWRADTLLAEGSVRVGCVDGVTLRPRRIPKQVLDAL